MTHNDLVSTVDSKGRQDRHKHVKTPWRQRADIIYGYLCLRLCTLQMFRVTQWSGCITYCCSGFGFFLSNDGCFVSLWRRGFWWFWCNNSGIIWSWLAKHCWLTCKSQMCVSVCTGEWMYSIQAWIDVSPWKHPPVFVFWSHHLQTSGSTGVISSFFIFLWGCQSQ